MIQCYIQSVKVFFYLREKPVGKARKSYKHLQVCKPLYMFVSQIMQVYNKYPHYEGQIVKKCLECQTKK